MSAPIATKERILEAASDIFGHEGFRATTIRRIAKSAQVNIAAINYHFGDKERLYAAVLEHVFHLGFTRFPSRGGIEPGMPPEAQLHMFIRGMFYRLLSIEAWYGYNGRGRLIARELLAPTPAFESILDRYIKPHKELLTEILIAIIGRDPGPQILLSLAVSIIGQCIYYAFAAPVIKRLTGDERPMESRLDQLSEFVWQFSLGGIARVTVHTVTGGLQPQRPSPLPPIRES